MCEAQALESAHRLVRLAGKLLERARRRLHVAQRRRGGLNREARDPAQRRALVALRIVVADQQAHAQRVVEADRRQFGGSGAYERKVALLEGAAETAVRGPGARHTNVCSQRGAVDASRSAPWGVALARGQRSRRIRRVSRTWLTSVQRPQTLART